MRTWKRKLALCLAAIMTVGCVLQAFGANGWQNENGNWYHITNEVRDTGWLQESEDAWYYLNRAGEGTEGQMRYGWYQDSAGDWYFLSTSHDGTFGKALTGWVWVDGYCYYFGSDCRMYVGRTTPDGYEVDADGRWISDGVVQRVDGKGYVSKHVHETQTAVIKSSSSRSSGRGSGSSSGGGSGNSGGSSSGGSSYRVYETANKQTLEANNNVKTFADKTTEDRERIQSVADSIVDYWVDAEAPESIQQEGAETGSELMTVAEIHLAVTSDSLLLEKIENEQLVENDVLYIPSSEAFPGGISIVYLGHDDDYEGTGITDYRAEDYEVIDAVEATFANIFGEEVIYSAGGVNEDTPIEFFWAPTLFGDTLVEQIEYQPENEEEIASDSNAEEGLEAFAEDVLETGLMSASLTGELPASNSNAAIPQAESLLMTSKARSSQVAVSKGTKAFAVNSSITSSGGNIVLTADKIVLFDADGNSKTTDDQIVMNGKIGLENVNPELGFVWDPSVSDLMPKQLKTVINYDKVVELDFSVKDSVSMKTFMEGMQRALQQPENKARRLHIFELQGVDMKNTVVLASFGVNVGLNKAAVNMTNIQNATDTLNPMDAMVVFMVLMDAEGEVSVKTTLELEHRDSNKSGLNVQKQGYVGNFGTQQENQGDYNAAISGYDINIYDSHDTFTAVTAKIEGDAGFDIGVGVGIGVMCMGFMPAMAKGTLGLETNFSGEGEVSWSDKGGITWAAEGEASIRAYLRAKVLLKLRVLADKIFGGQKELVNLEAEFDLADLTLLEEKYSESVPALRYDGSYFKYFTYTDDQLKAEFNSVVADVENLSGGQYVTTAYYDGQSALPFINSYGEIDWANVEEDTGLVIVVGETVTNEGEILQRSPEVNVRLKKVIVGMRGDETARDLNVIGNLSVEDYAGYGFYNMVFRKPDQDNICIFTSSIVNTSKDSQTVFGGEEFLFGTYIQEVSAIFEQYGYDEGCSKVMDYFSDKRVNPDVFVWLDKAEHQIE